MTPGAPIDPRDVRRAEVHKAGRLAGHLDRGDGTVTFTYDPAYLTDAGPAVATTLPLTDQPVVSPAGAVPPFFAGLLPEGRRLTNLRTAIKASADDELSQLIAVGDDPVGDVRVLSPGTLGQVPQPVAAVEGDFSDLDFTELLADAGVIDPTSLAGVQDKVSGRMLSIPLRHHGRAHLLKLDPPEFPHVVANEAFFLDRARRLRQAVVTSEVVRDRHGRPALLIERFDRVEVDGVLTSLAVEDGAQLLGRYPADKYSVSLEDLARRIGEVCAATPVALRALFSQVVFSWLIGNGDLHAKNVSVIQRAGEWRVSPIYDTPSTLPYADHRAALPIAGRRDGWSRKSLMSFAERIGLPTRAAERVMHEALAATEGLVDEVAALPFDARRQRDLSRGLTARRRSLEG